KALKRGVYREKIFRTAKKNVESRSGAVATDAAPFPLPAHQTGRADFPHPAFGQGSFMPSPTAGCQSELPIAGARTARRDAPGKRLASRPLDLMLSAQPSTEPIPRVAIHRAIGSTHRTKTEI